MVEIIKEVIYSYLDLGFFHMALKIVNKTIEKAPKNPDLWYLRGLTYESLGRYKEAIKNYRKAYSLNPKFSSPKIKAAYCMLHLVTALNSPILKEADFLIEDVLQKEPRNAEALFVKSLILAYRGWKESALAYVNEALKEKPDHQEANEWRSALQSMIRRHPDTSSAH